MRMRKDHTAAKTAVKLLFAAVLAVFITVCGTGRAYAASADGKTVPEGVSVCGIDLGNMKIAEAEEMLNEYAQGVTEGTLTLTLEDSEDIIPYADFDVRIADNTIIEEICEIGTHGNLIRRYKELADVKNDNAEYDLTFEYDEDKLAVLVEEKALAHDQEAVDATMTRSGGNFKITSDESGIAVDADATLEAVKEALGEDWDGSSVTVEIAAQITEAAYTMADFELSEDLLGSYSTSLSSSTSDRKSNIANAAGFIDGTVLYPGDTFSYLDHIGPVTESNGYKEAHGYSNGEVIDTVGGGICQGSTTLYNAVLRAELEVVSRRNHSMTVSYVPLAADAAVSWSSGMDFKFRNNTDYPIYIEAYSDGSYVYMNIYGRETRPENRTIKFKSVTEETIEPGDDIITEDSTKETGYREVTQSAYTGYVASLYKEVYIDGKLTDTVLINKSTYRATPRHVTVGTKSSGTDKNTGSTGSSSSGSGSSGSSSSGSSSSGSGSSGSGSSGSGSSGSGSSGSSSSGSSSSGSSSSGSGSASSGGSDNKQDEDKDESSGSQSGQGDEPEENPAEDEEDGSPDE